MPPKKVTPRGKAAKAPEVAPVPKAPQKRSRKSAPAKKKQNDFVRNKWGSEVRITLSEMNDERRIELKPRGQRGDLARVSNDEWDDDKMDRSLVELIPAELATEIMNGQLTNQQTPHSALEALRNPLGQPYTQAPSFGITPGQEPQVVARVQETGPAGHIDQNEQVVRQPGAAPQQAAVPGSIQNPVVPDAMTQDWLARQGGGEAQESQSAEALRESLNPKVLPPKRNITPGQ